MITFTVSVSPDTSLLGEHRYFKNCLLLGRTHGDLRIDDPAWAASHLYIETNPECALVHKGENVASFLLNGKLTRTSTVVQAGDTLTLGQTQIVLGHLEYTQIQSKKEIVQRNLQAIESDPELGSVKTLITQIETTLKEHFPHSK